MKKISQLNQGTPDNSDLLVYVDVSENETKGAILENAVGASRAEITELTGGGDTTLHTHDSRYYTETEVDTNFMSKATYDPSNTARQVAFACTIQSTITDYTFTGTEPTSSGYLVTTASNRTVNINADLFTTGYEVIFCKGTDNANTVTLDAGSGNNINGSQTYILDKFNETVVLVKDGDSTWKIKAGNVPKSTLVQTTGDQTIDGVKTFNDNVFMDTSVFHLTEDYQIRWFNPTRTSERARIYGTNSAELIFSTGNVSSEKMRLRANGALVTGVLETTGDIMSPAIAIIGDRIERYATDSDTAGIGINYRGYNGGTTRFRDFKVFDGKQNEIIKVTGSTGLLSYNSVGSQFGAGKVLTSDASGNATWQVAIGAIGAIGAKATTASFASGLTLTTVPFASESFDTNTFHDNVTNNSRLTIPTGMSGLYQISVNGKVNGAVGYTQTGVQLFKNGTLLTVGGGGYDQWIPGFSVSEIENCSAGDYFEVKIQTDVNRTWNYIGFSIIKL